MIEIKGDLFEGIEDKNRHSGTIIIPHVCNNQNGFASGFVAPLARKFPLVKECYHSYIEEYKDADCEPLGTTQFVEIPNTRFIVANMIAQTLGGKRPLFYNHLVDCMEDVADTVMCRSEIGLCEIVCPKFGSALAGGNWEFIKELIEDCWEKRGIKVTVYAL